MTNYNSGDNAGLKGVTGSGKYVGDTSPILVTPTIGAATATSVAFSPTTGGIIGTTAADNAGAGKVGEFITSSVLFGSAVSLADSTAKNITSITLTAGDWDVFGNGFISPTGTNTVCVTWISSTSATLPDASLRSQINVGVLGFGAAIFPQRFNVNTNTTVYLSGYCSFTSGTASASGTISARRVR